VEQKGPALAGIELIAMVADAAIITGATARNNFFMRKSPSTGQRGNAVAAGKLPKLFDHVGISFWHLIRRHLISSCFVLF
jgi:hypothetical protein